jgi:Xaa-Pro dipeptidase
MIETSGSQHARLLNEVVPGILREGMSETDFFAEVYENMIKLGHHGVSRFAMPQMELVLGQLGFGENALYPTNFNGPGGMKGMSPAVPIIGDRHRLLKKGDIVFLDVGFGFNGYHSDKTQVYCFNDAIPDQATIVHKACRSVMKRVVEQLKPGAIPASIYRSIMEDIPPVLQNHFMGFTDDPVRFLGHGVGLQIDESPVIADRITTPLSENMVIAVEPKCGVPGIGMLGVEETYVITRDGARCLTGGDQDIMIV